MTILHAHTDPDLLTRLKQMLGSAARADIAVGYLFMSGFGEVVDELARLNKTRILVGRADRSRWKPWLPDCIGQMPCGLNWTWTGPFPGGKGRPWPAKPCRALPKA